jgi:hypothetical protein
MWPAMIVRELNQVLPEPYFAAPGIHLGTLYEIDVGTYEDAAVEAKGIDPAGGGAAIATYAPPQPTLTLEPRLPHQDLYEVRIYDSRRNRRLVAAIEIVSPSNKDRPEPRGTFVSKVAALLKHDICVAIVDVVGTIDFSLYAELMSFLESADASLGEDPTPMYAVTLRMRHEGHRRLMDNWYHELVIGRSLPALPIWLTETTAVSLELESSYEETCRWRDAVGALKGPPSVGAPAAARPDLNDRKLRRYCR